MNVLLPLLLCRIRFRTRFHTRYRTRFRGRFRYEKIMKTICFLYDLTVFQPIPKSHIFTLHFCSPYVANLKNPRFLRHTQGFSHQSQFAVNPYVTGSSPVARATISAGFRGFFIFYRHLHDINFDVFLHCIKWRKPAHYLYTFGSKLHICTRGFPEVSHSLFFRHTD